MVQGFRYELWCTARAVQTPLATVFVDTPADVCEKWNRNASERFSASSAPPNLSPSSAAVVPAPSPASPSLPSASNSSAALGTSAASFPVKEPYPDAVLADLLGRFETPNDRNKWDRPCFVFHPAEESYSAAGYDVAVAHGEAHEAWTRDWDERTRAFAREVFDAITANASVPNLSMATEKRPIAPTTLLHEIDSITLKVVAAITEAQRDGAIPPQVCLTTDNFLRSLFLHCTTFFFFFFFLNINLPTQVAIPGTSVRVILTRAVGAPELRQIRSSFVSLTKLKPPADASQMISNFVHHINSCVK
jgi:hypothetical protein